MTKKTNIIKNCGKCDICKKILISDSSFICMVMNKKYIKNDFDCNSVNVYLIVVRIVINNTQVLLYIDFKTHFRIHESDINTKKD